MLRELKPIQLEDYRAPFPLRQEAAKFERYA